MENQYDNIFQQIVDPAKDNPVLLIYTDIDLGRLRAGLSARKQHYNKLQEIMGGEGLADKQFKYTRNPEDSNKITVSLEDIPQTDFKILNPG